MYISLFRVSLYGLMLVHLQFASAADDVNLCPSTSTLFVRPTVDPALQTDEIILDADEVHFDGTTSYILDGNAVITTYSQSLLDERDYSLQQIKADWIKYDDTPENQNIDMRGNIHYWTDLFYLQGDAAHLELAQSGSFSNAYYVLLDRQRHGRARHIAHKIGKSTDMQEEVTYTTCLADNKFWQLHAKRLHLDHQSHWGKVYHATLKVKDTPVFYTPYLSFPLNDDRKSGFLAPQYGLVDEHGFELRIPYYWNIKPNMDLTFTPRFFTKNNIMLAGEYRYLLPQGQGSIGLEYLPNDRANKEKKGNSRNFVSIKHQSNLGDNGKLVLDYNRASDRFYFSDFGSQLDVVSTRFLERLLVFSYHDTHWRLQAQLQEFQLLDRTNVDISESYKSLPSISFDYLDEQRYAHFSYGLNGEFSYFKHRHPSNPEGARIYLQPYMSYLLQTSGVSFRPKIGWTYTRYELQDHLNDDPSITAPFFSLDSQVSFERTFSMLGSRYLQTLSPRLFYLYRPHRDQASLPLFDTQLYDFSYEAIFRENRFSGYDRQADSNQLALAVTSSIFNHAMDKEIATMSIGQLFYFEDRLVNLNTQPRTDSRSDWIGQFQTTLFKHWQFDSNILWNTYTDKPNKLNAGVRYNPERNKIINLSYRFRDNSELDQTDFSLYWPLSKKANLIGRWNYSLDRQLSLEQFIGIEYNSCCWGARLVARRFLKDNQTDSEFGTGVFLQVTLKGLGTSGNRATNFLQEQIKGYQNVF